SMPVQRTYLVTGGSFPDPDRGIAAARCQLGAVRTDGHASDRARMPAERTKVPVAKAIAIVPFPAARIGLAWWRVSIGFQQVKDPRNASVFPIRLYQVHPC